MVVQVFVLDQTGHNDRDSSTARRRLQLCDYQHPSARQSRKIERVPVMMA